MHEIGPSRQCLERARISYLKLRIRTGFDKAIDEESRLTDGVGGRGQGTTPEGDCMCLDPHLRHLKEGEIVLRTMVPPVPRRVMYRHHDRAGGSEHPVELAQ